MRGPQGGPLGGEETDPYGELAGNGFSAPESLTEALAAKSVLPKDPTRILVGFDLAVAEWVRQHLPEDGVQVETWGPCAALGIAIGDELVAGVVYSLFIWPSIEASIASISPRWCSRRNLQAIFAFPFRQKQCRRLGATTSATNQPVRAFLSRLGFREEGTLRQFLPHGDAVIYGMTPQECRWLSEI